MPPVRALAETDAPGCGGGMYGLFGRPVSPAALIASRVGPHGSEDDKKTPTIIDAVLKVLTTVNKYSLFLMSMRIFKVALM